MSTSPSALPAVLQRFFCEHLIQQRNGRREILVGLGREAHDQVGRKADLRPPFAQPAHPTPKPGLG